MIFVTVGTTLPIDDLIRHVDRMASEGKFANAMETQSLFSSNNELVRVLLAMSSKKLDIENCG